ncbi:MAG: VanW family protein [Ruminococcus sp.]|nr:VanW family protein [Ruminococcus sp.]
MFWNKDKLFCDINPTCYAISEQKEIIKRHISDLRGKENYAKLRTRKRLPVVVYSQSSHLIKKGPGIDPVLQENKAVNIRLACKKINGIIIRPGEIFSFWHTVGKTTKRRGYRDGRVIVNGKLIPGIGGGLCNLSNTIHRTILHSPLEVTEFHQHSDALAPDEGKRVPFSSGTSVNYNYIDYRFRNNTGCDVQLLAWCDEEELHIELRSKKEFPETYKITEEGHHFQKEEDGKYYRVSKIYKNAYDRSTGELISKELVLDNHSEVMFDPDLIPHELIKEPVAQ